MNNPNTYRGKQGCSVRSSAFVEIVMWEKLVAIYRLGVCRLAAFDQSAVAEHVWLDGHGICWEVRLSPRLALEKRGHSYQPGVNGSESQDQQRTLPTALGEKLVARDYISFPVLEPSCLVFGPQFPKAS